MSKLENALNTGRFLVQNPKEIQLVPRWIRGRWKDPWVSPSPWWTYRSVEWIETQLTRNSHVFEYGSGASTLWLADRVATVESIEHDSAWYSKAASRFDRENITVRLVPPTASGTVTSPSAEGFLDSYVASIHTSAKLYSLVVVDGRARVACFKAAMEHVAPGGVLLLDDSHRTEYAPAQRLCNWPRHDFKGLKSGVGMVAQTTCWTRPQD